MFLMYTGGDNFVWPDSTVGNFVARSLGLNSMAASRAASLLRQCAHELLLSPRYLDFRVWTHGQSGPCTAPPACREED